MRRKLVSGFAGTWTALFVLAAVASADDIRITKEELQKKANAPGVVVVDVRTGKDWSASEFKIRRAVRVPLKEVGVLATKYSKDTTLVFYGA